MADFFFWILLQGVPVLSGCSVCDKEFLLREFQKENPKAKVISIQVGEGDADVGYYHIRYCLPSDQVEHESVWQCFGDSSRSILGKGEKIRRIF